MADKIESIRKKYLGKNRGEVSSDPVNFDTDAKLQSIREKYMPSDGGVSPYTAQILNHRTDWSSAVSPEYAAGRDLAQNYDRLYGLASISTLNGGAARNINDSLTRVGYNPTAAFGVTNPIVNDENVRAAAMKQYEAEEQRRGLAPLPVEGNTADDVITAYQGLRDREDEAKYNQYMTLIGNDDFDSLSEYRTTKKRNDGSGTGSDVRYTSTLYEQINNNEELPELQKGFNNLREMRYQLLSEDEKRVFNYLYNKEGYDSAKAFLDSFDTKLNARMRKEAETHFAEQARTEGDAAALGRNIMESPLKSLSAVANVVNLVKDGRIDQNAWYNSPVYRSVARSQEATKDMSPVGQFLYGTAESMGSFLLNTLVSQGLGGAMGLTEKGVERLALSLMSSQAASQTLVTAKDSGYSDGQAVMLSALAGFAEYITERYSIEALLNVDSLHAGKWSYIAKNVLAEGSEEFGSDMINWLGEILILGDKSQWRKKINDYVKLGCSENDAFAYAIVDQAMQSGLSALGGALSGFALSAGNVALNDINLAALGYQFKQENDNDALMDLARKGMENDSSSAAFKGGAMMEKALEKGKTPSALRVGTQIQYNAAADLEDAQSNVIIAQAVQHLKEDGEITREDAKAIRENLMAQQEIFGSLPEINLTESGINAAIKHYADLNESIYESDRRAASRALVASGAARFEREATTIAPSSANNLHIRNVLDAQTSIENATRIADTVRESKPELANLITVAYEDIAQNELELQSTPGVDFATAMIKAYDLGTQNKSAIKVTEGFSQIAAKYITQAHDAGVRAAEGGINAEEAGRQSNGGGNERVPGLGTAEQVEGIRDEILALSRDDDRRSAKTVLRSYVTSVAKVKPVSGQSQGIEDASSAATMRILPESGWNPRMKKLAKYVRSLGMEFVPFVGPISMKDGSTARGAWSSNGKLYVRVDHDMLTPEQIALHELFHGISDKYGTDNMHELMRQKIIDKYNGDEAKLKALTDAYAKAYAKYKMSPDNVFEELLADAFAGIDIFDYIQWKHVSAADVTDVVGKETDKIASGITTRGPPSTTAQDLERKGVEITDEGTATKFSYDTWTATDKKVILSALMKAGFQKSVAQKWIDNVNSIAAIIAADRYRLDYDAADNQVMLKNNDEYVKTLDASTLCAKRLLYQGTFNRITELLPNTILLPDDLIHIRKVMADLGDTVPCGICYVESRRKTLSKFAGQWLNEVYKGKIKVTMNDLTSTDGLEKLRKQHPGIYDDYTSWMRRRGKANPKIVELRTAYRNDISKLTKGQIDKITRIGGLRVQSFSDFETVHLIDMMQAILDMSAKKLTSQAYTKVPNFAWAFGDTGIKINLSLIGKAENGKLVFDPKEGMPIEDAMKLRERYSDNVGTILVGANDESILLAMADDRIDFIIPFHRSGWSKDQFEALGLSGYDDYQNYQNERNLDGSSIKDGNLYPIDYWDYSKTGKENAERYLEICKEQKRIPKFEKFLVDNGDGSWSLQPDGSTDGYWKMLIDFKMYNNEGIGVPQRAVTPDFNMAECERILDEYDGTGNRSLPVDEKAAQRFVKEYKAEHKDVQRFSQAFDSLFTTMDDGRIKPNNVADLSTEDWKLIRTAVNKLGYGIESVAQAKEVYSRYVGTNGFNKEQSEAIMRAYGVAPGKKSSVNPSREALARKTFGTTGDFREAGYLMRNGSMLDFSGKKDGGPAHVRYMDHREIAAVFGDDELSEDRRRYGDNTAYMNAFISEGNIRLMDGQGVTIGETEPTSQQYTILKQFADRVLREEGYFYLDLSNDNGYTVASREYYPSDGSARIIRDIKEYFKNGELPYKSDLSQFRFSRVLDPAEIKRLNSEPTVTVYRAMQVIDGELYPPMAAKLKDDAGKNRLVEPTELGAWYRADERPDLIKDGKFALNKGNGSTPLNVAYNPYWHTSRSMLNDQFSSAYKRPNLVTVECEVPESELTSGYKAEFAKDAVGEMQWHSGPVSSKLAKEGNPRRVILSRWVKVNRIVPDSEAAASIANMLKGTDITIPENTVTPSLKEELIKQGITVGEEGQPRFSRMSFADEVDAVISGEWSRRDAVYVRETPEILQAVGLKDYPIFTTKVHIKNAVAPENEDLHQHGIDLNVVKQLPELLDDPIMIMESRSKPGDIVVITSKLASPDPRTQEKRPIMASIRPDGHAKSNGIEFTSNFDTSLYGRNNFSDFLESAVKEGRMLYADEKRIQNILGPGYNSLGVHNTAGFFEKNIARFTESSQALFAEEDFETKTSRAPLPENADETAREVVNNLYRRAGLQNMSMKYGNYNYAAYTDERINQEINYSYAEGSRNKDYARAYIAFIKPEDFIMATSSSIWRDQLYAEVKGKAKEEGRTSMLNLDALTNERQSMYLRIKTDENGRAVIDGHEGRHRMIGLEAEGYKYVPVIIEPREYGYPAGQDRYHTKPISSLYLEGQSFYEGHGTGFFLHDILPLSANYADIAREVFASGDSVTRFSRDTDSLAKYTDETQKRIERLQEALKKQTERAEHFKGETHLKLTKDGADRYQVSDKGLRQIVNTLQKSYGSDADIAEDLRTLINDFLNGRTDRNAAFNAAIYIGNHLIAKSKELVNPEDEQTLRRLKEYLKHQKISINDHAKSDIPDYEAFRRRNLSRIRLTHDGLGMDVVYMELQDTFGKGLFSDGIDTQSEQLLQLDEVLKALQPAFENPFTSRSAAAEAVDAVAVDIINTLLNSDEIDKVAPTFADKQKMRREKEVKGLREYYTNKIADIRARKEKAIQHLKDNALRARELKRDREMRTRLLKIVKRLQNKKLPAVQRQLLDQYIGDIDTVAKSITGTTIQNLTALRDWYEDQKQNNPDFIADKITEDRIARLSKRRIGDMTQEEVVELTQVLLNIENEIAYQKRLIDEQERRDIYELARVASDDIMATKGTNLKAQKADRYFIMGGLSGERAIRRMTGYVDDDPLYQLTLKLSEGQRDMLDFQRRAYHMVQHFTEDKSFVESLTGKKAKRITIEGTERGKRVKVDITPAERISLYLHSKNDSNLYHIRYGGISIPDFNLLTQGKLEQAYDDSVKRTITLTPSEIRDITSQMDDKELAFANAISAYFNGMSQQEINEVSEKLKGYSLAQVENYFPIETDDNFLSAEYETLQMDGTIEGMGFLKERVQKSSTAINLREAQQVLNQSIRMTSKYVGLAIPVRNMSKVLNVRLVDYYLPNDPEDTMTAEAGKQTEFKEKTQEGTIRKAIGIKWHTAGKGYVQDLMTDLQNPRHDEDTLGSFMNKITSNYAGAVLEMNLGVAIKQAASYPTAMAVLGYRPLVQAFTVPGEIDIRTIEKYTPLFWYRSLGYSTTELGDMASGIIKNIPTQLKWIQMIDLKTTKQLWKASEMYVRNNPASANLMPGTDDYYKEVARIYNRVIEETQPNYTVMQRPELLRSKNALTRALNLFKTQPYQNFGLLYDAVQNYKAKQSAFTHVQTPDAEKALKKAKKELVNAIVSQLLAALLFAVMQGAWDGMRGKTKAYRDKAGNANILTVGKGLTMNMLSTGFGMVPLGSFGLEFIENAVDKVSKSVGGEAVFDQSFYGAEVPVIETLNGIAEGLGSVLSTIAGTIHDISAGDGVAGWETLRDLYKASAQGFQAAGVPVQNTVNFFNMIAQNAAHTFEWANGNWYLGYYRSLRIQGANNTEMYKNLYQAYTHDMGKYTELYNEMISDGYSEAAIKNFFKKMNN